MPEINDEELLEKYFRNQLDDNQKLVFQEKMKEDDFAMKQRAHQKALLALELGMEKKLKERWQAKEGEILQKKDPKAKKTKRLTLSVLTVAASVAACVLFFFLWQRTHTTEMDYLALYFEPARNIEYPTQRGVNPEVLSLKEKAYSAYDQANYNLAIGLFQMSQEESTIDNYFLANALLMEGRMEEAIPLLEAVKDSQSDYSAPAQWALALAYLQLGQNEKAIPLLDSLNKQTGVFQQRTQDLLESLK
jgi:tetratricopeptide (TPR) repeat protein